MPASTLPNDFVAESHVLYIQINIKFMPALESSVEFDSRLGARVILVVIRDGDEQTKLSSNLV